MLSFKCNRNLSLQPLRRCTFARNSKYRQGIKVKVKAQQDDNNKQPSMAGDAAVLGFIAIALAAGATAGLSGVRDTVEELLYDLSLSDGTIVGNLGAGGLLGAFLWSLALYFATPLQLLLLFLGRIDTERPASFMEQAICRALKISRDDDPGFTTPLYVRAAVVGICVLEGAGMSALFSLSLGDSSWAISSGMGALLAAGVYEAGRPRQMNADEAKQLESQWQDFARFADERLQRGGRCHESEVWSEFRARCPRYRDPEVLDEPTLRTMVRNWHPDVDRTPNGFYRNLSVRPRVDAFTGDKVGTELRVRTVEAPTANLPLEVSATL